MKNILVIQTHELADLLQSTPVLAALRSKLPKAGITCLVRKALAEALRGNPDADEVMPWDTDALATTDHPNGAAMARSKRELAAFVESLRSRKFDTVVNLSNDLPTALLTYLLEPRTVIGLAYSADRTYRVRNEWMRRLFVATEVRGLNTMNVADMMVEACGGTEDARPRLHCALEDLDAADERIRMEFGPDARPIAVYPRRDNGAPGWGVGRYAELMDTLAHSGSPLLLLGCAEARDQSQAILDGMSRPAGVLDLTGHGGQAFAPAVMKRCRLLITDAPDAAQMAAAMETPSLTLAFGSDCPVDSGPYGDGHYILEPCAQCFPCETARFCRNIACREKLSVDAVLDAVRCIQTRGERIPHRLLRAPVVFSRTTWMPDGLLGLRPLNRPMLTFPILHRAILRACGLACSLSVSRVRPDPDWRPWTGTLLRRYRLADLPSVIDQALIAAHSVSELGRLAELGARTARAAASVNTDVMPGAQSVDPLFNALPQIEGAILDKECEDALRFPVTAFRHGLRDLADDAGHYDTASRRSLFLCLARECDFIERAFKQFAAAARETAPGTEGLTFLRGDLLGAPNAQ